MKPSIPKGTRDFSPSEMVRRNFIFSTVKKVFEQYGYQPIETPAMENLETLMGKYGEEGDKLIFRILNSGDFYKPIQDLVKKLVANVEIDKGEMQKLSPPQVIEHMVKNAETYKKISEITSFDILTQLSEKALRYDLTVPFARYVVQHQNEITFPFKRYQIQSVWRADRPQKGRYREFYQCDADVIGSNSLLNEVEIVQIIDQVFTLLKIPVTIRVNNRKILSGIVEELGIDNNKTMIVITTLDKLDKIGVDGVEKELIEKGLEESKIKELIKFIDEKLAFNIASLSNFGVGSSHTFEKSEVGRSGIQELQCVTNYFKYFGPIALAEDEKNAEPKIPLRLAEVKPDFFLARGLTYYTGAIFEVKANDVQIGSICGGGRYDDLTGIFGLPNVSGVGISFGIDRIYDVMNELALFDKIGLPETTTRVMLAHFKEEERNYCISIASKLRSENINTEIYPDIVKIKKQFDYANKKQIPFVIVIGPEEMQTGKLTLKNMSSGEQEKISLKDTILKLKI